jgi:hypothetical protein
VDTSLTSTHGSEHEGGLSPGDGGGAGIHVAASAGHSGTAHDWLDDGRDAAGHADVAVTTPSPLMHTTVRRREEVVPQGVLHADHSKATQAAGDDPGDGDGVGDGDSMSARSMATAGEERCRRGAAALTRMGDTPASPSSSSSSLLMGSSLRIASTAPLARVSVPATATPTVTAHCIET